MRRISIADLRGYLLNGTLTRRGCLQGHPPGRSIPVIGSQSCRALHSAPDQPASTPPSASPLRKQLKEEARQARKDGRKKLNDSQTVDGWELTVGIEIHAQLNTSRKLFSSAATSFNDDPNSHVAPFDLSMPGSQPIFQEEVLVPAIRAALALNCGIQAISRFDRKHYFWWDQPSGYQITQYYEPLAKCGTLTLNKRDGIAAEDGDGVTVRIKQIQLEQDTAKTLAQASNVHWLDFNRVGVPLVEIITEPDLHHPRTAAAFVRKVQLLLNTVDACVSGMEAGGLRADVNVSVRRRGDMTRSLGTRTEIKNLSTIKAVEDAIVAERDRQIRELEAGGVIAGETRGWSLGAKGTHRLRGKEGEVDYRYMPDPDIAPLVVGDDLVDYLRESLAVLPDIEMDRLTSELGLTPKDAMSLITLDSGARVQYYYRVQERLRELTNADASNSESSSLELNSKRHSTLAANWIIHELGRLTTYKAGPLANKELSFTADGECTQIPAEELSQLLYHLYSKHITGKVAKELLVALYLGELEDGVFQAIESNDLWFNEISRDEYLELAQSALAGEDKVLQEFLGCEIFPQGKLMYLVGKMMRIGPTERIDPATAERIMRERVSAVSAP